MKKTWNNPIHHKNGTSLIGNNNDKKKKQTRKHKNKSIDINNKVFNQVVNTNNLNKLNLSYIFSFLIYDRKNLFF